MINQINPLLKAPIEVAFNMDSFNGRTVNGRQWMGRNGPFMWNKFPKPLRDYFELEQTRRADGSVGYTANGTKVHLVFKSWALGRILNTASLTEMFGDTSGNLNENAMFSVWKLLTGMEFREFDLNTAHKEMLRNRIDRLETELIDRGVMRQFTKVYQPKLAPVVGGR